MIKYLSPKIYLYFSRKIKILLTSLKKSPKKAFISRVHFCVDKRLGIKPRNTYFHLLFVTFALKSCGNTTRGSHLEETYLTSPCQQVSCKNLPFYKWVLRISSQAFPKMDFEIVIRTPS